MLVGAHGTLGSVILSGLLAHEQFTVTILQRKKSNSRASAHENNSRLSVTKIEPEFDLIDLTSALRGFDVVIAAFPLTDVSVHLRLVEAAFRAEVRRYIPADYGSCDAASPRAQELLKLYRDKTMVQNKCEKLATSSSTADGENGSNRFTWTSIICGHFFDSSLQDGFLHFNLDTCTARILDGGGIKASASTLRRVAEAVVAILQMPEKTANKALFVQSFNPSQNDILASLQKATGREWKREELDSNKYLEDTMKQLEGGDDDAVGDVVFVLGTMDADWTTRDGFAMELLGLRDEDLDEVVAKVVQEHESQRVT